MAWARPTLTSPRSSRFPRAASSVRSRSRRMRRRTRRFRRLPAIEPHRHRQERLDAGGRSCGPDGVGHHDSWHRRLWQWCWQRQRWQHPDMFRRLGRRGRGRRLADRWGRRRHRHRHGDAGHPHRPGGRDAVWRCQEPDGHAGSELHRDRWIHLHRADRHGRRGQPGVRPDGLACLVAGEGSRRPW